MLTREDLPTFALTTNLVNIGRSGFYLYASSAAAPFWTIGLINPAGRKRDPQIYFVTSRNGAITITASGSDTFLVGGVTSTTLTVNPGESVLIVTDGTYWLPMYSTSTRLVTSAAVTLTLARAGHIYVFTGTTTTWTLPAVSASTGVSFTIKNRGSGAITLARAGTDSIYDTAAQTSLTIAAGATVRLTCDGTYWLVL